MGYRCIFIFFGVLLLTFSLQGEDCQCQPSCEDDKTPLFGAFEYNSISKADFEKDSLKHQHLQYSMERVRLGSVVWYNPSCEEGAAASFAYTKTHLGWKENPYFKKSYFETATMSFSGFSARLDDWLWKADVSLHLDTDPCDPEKYLFWDLLLWGRYDYCDDLALHFGFFAETGMKFDRVYPILGFDWKCWEKLTLNLVFPVDISALWEFNSNWAAGAAIRFFESRHRVGKNEHLTRALWVYQATGAELGVIYNCTDFIHANLHFGYSFGGKLKIANRNNDDPHHFDFESSPYIGCEVKLSY